MKKENFLDFTPCRNPLYAWDMDSKGIVTVHVVNKGFYNWLAQRLFHRPRVSHIRMDEYGSFVWQQLDGKKTVYEISGLVKEKFENAAEPLLDRLVQFFKVLYRNRFVC